MRSVLLLASEHDLRAARPQIARGLLADLADADQQDAAAVEVAEHLLGERRGRRRDRRGALPDRRLRPHLASGMQRLAKDAIEQQPGRTRLVGGANLAEDLAFARDERVETGGDAEQVQRGSLVAQAIERGLDLRLELCERGDRALLGLAGVLRDDVELGAVARREAHGLTELERQRRGGLTIERDPFAQLDRCVMVRGADKDEMHHAKWVAGRASRTRIDERKAGERDVRGAAAGPAVQRRTR